MSGGSQARGEICLTGRLRYTGPVAERDHYQTLGVPRFAAPAVVRAAFLATLKRHHAAGGTVFSEERLRQLGLAYWELRHPTRRAAYDGTLRDRERRRTALGKPVVKRAAPRVQLAPPRRDARPGTRWAFAASLILLAGGVAWTLEHRPAPRPPVLATRLVPEAMPRVTMIDEALLDYQAMMAAGGRAHVAQAVRQCFADMRASAPPGMFDYCVALDGLAAADLPKADEPGYWSEAERRARLAGVAFQPAAQAEARWEAVNRLAALRLPNRR